MSKLGNKLERQQVSEWPRDMFVMNRQTVELALDMDSTDATIVLLGIAALYGIFGPDIEDDASVVKHTTAKGEMLAMWRGIKASVNMSIAATERAKTNGRKGGRPRKPEQSKASAETSKTPLS